jgi:hypothetical protein
VDTVPRELAAYNPKRVGIVIFNNGTGRIYISENPANIIDTGFPLENGASFSLLKVDGDDPTVALWAQAESGTQDIRVAESWG